MFGRKYKSILDTIKYLPSKNVKRDYFLKMVISTMQTTKWLATYGLNLTETMKLEFGDYLLMAEELRTHTEKIKTAAENAKNELLSK